MTITHDNAIVCCVGTTLSKIEVENYDLLFEKGAFALGLGEKGYRSEMGNKELVTGDRMSELRCLLDGSCSCSASALR